MAFGHSFIGCSCYIMLSLSRLIHLTGITLKPNFLCECPYEYLQNLQHALMGCGGLYIFDIYNFSKYILSHSECCVCFVSMSMLIRVSSLQINEKKKNYYK